MQVIINAAMTIDGKIATRKGDSAISSKDDLARVHRLRSAADAVVVGISTVIADNPKLTVRLVKGRNPARVIVDSNARIPLDSQILLSASKVRTIIAVTKGAPKEKILKIKDMGAAVVVAGAKGNVDVSKMFLALEEMGIRKVLVEGGGELNWSILQTGIIDDLIVTIAPIIAGGRSATTLVEGEGFAKISDSIKFKLIRVLRKRSGEVVLHYKPVR
jgi:2,5-diamino-6-(ribosylamino)-4(3H)-pyrimidinone 5'-phosphate reductase